MSVLRSSRFRVGETVEVLSPEEIFATLDANGCVDGMPFMPEMLPYCGRRYTVAMSAHKTCDTIRYTGNLRMPDTVHLEGLRCDGAAHGGCQATCLMFWKTVWLKPVRSRDRDRAPAIRQGSAGRFTEEMLRSRTQVADPSGETRYVCQVTEIPRASRLWPWWSPGQYLQDILSGNWSIGHVAGVLALAILRKTILFVRGYRLQMGLYNLIARKTGRDAYASVVDFRGPIPLDAPTPEGPNVLKPGDWVRIKPLKEISATLNIQGKNRGLFFDSEMVPYCGGQYRVSGIVRQIIDEGSGRMMHMKNPCVALEGVICRSEYSVKRLMCPRSIVPVWRPIWLEKVDMQTSGSSVPAARP